MRRPRLVVVTGPTASGKTACGIALAQALGGEIVSADSMQVYRHLDIGTAKPSLEERGLVPHHLIDVADPDETYHVGRYRDEAATAIAGILGRGRVPIVVGGTALYLKALLRGLAEAPGRDETTRRELEARWGAGEAASLFEELRRVDPTLAARLHPNDRVRIVRGLEVWRAVGRPLSVLHAEHRFEERPYDALHLGMELDRADLYRRIDARVAAMVSAGWVDEVRRVLALGYAPGLAPLQALGYRQLCAYALRGGDLKALIVTIQQETRRFAKRQMTWFRRMDLAWTDPRAPQDAVERAKNFLQRGFATI
ncbi:MAG: tRNA (adenosine(37)-N6)-dimethylallyltransferase MiaA [Deltaproteobacteria bacterium]|nr:tRNA (adenosine(37)-N6)-dimethylallyltransferase MiaA [Deltaproteobacteria bacterium]